MNGFFTVFFFASNCHINIPWTRHSSPLTCTDWTFLPLKFNCSTTERWTERDIFITFRATARLFLHFAQNYLISVPKTLQSCVEHWGFSIKQPYCRCVMPSGNKQHFICIKTWARINQQILPFPSPNGCTFIMFPNKFVVAMIRWFFLFYDI